MWVPFLALAVAVLLVTSAVAVLVVGHHVPRRYDGVKATLPSPHLMAPRRAISNNAVVRGAMTFHGGPVQNAPRVFVVFWGWTADPAGEAPYLTNFLSSLGGTAWLGAVTEYGGGDPPGLYGGAWSDATPIPAQPSDMQIQDEAVAAANHFGLGTSVNINMLVATPSGHSTSGFNKSYCAYHGPLAARPDVAYTNFPYLPDAGVRCGQGSVNGTAGRLDGVSIIAGHEVAEVITDPLLNAWFDTSAFEIADKCAWTNLGEITTDKGRFAVQPLWSNAAGGCIRATRPPLPPPPPPPMWTSWLSEIGVPPPGIASGSSPTVASWAPNRLDLFVEGADQAIWHAWWDGQRWNGWENRGPKIASSPAAVSWAPDHIDLFAVGPFGQIRHQQWNGRTWTPWLNEIGAPPPGIAPRSAPTVASWAANRLDLFVQGADHAIWHAWWDGQRWKGWENRGPTIASSPAAASWAPNHVDLFGVGSDGHIWHQQWNGRTWTPWLSEIGAPPPGIASASSPTVASWAANRLDLFVQGADRAVWHAWWDGQRWNGWENRGPTIVTTPAAVSWAANRIDLFGVGSDGHIWHQFFG